ncbi:MAG: hypothetical protein GY719_36575 [bacterium]|nr:hypothetical protein [bacterium]
MVSVLIPTFPRDVHAHAVKAALEAKGHEARLWYGTDYPTRQLVSIFVSRSEGARWRVTGQDVDLCGEPFDVVWYRRPSRPVLTADLAPAELDPADLEFARRECELFTRSLWHLIPSDGFWVNPREGHARAGSKPLQIHEAVSCGLEVPPTLFSNDPAEIRRFLQDNDGETIYKAYHPARWTSDEGVAFMLTNTLTLDDLPDDEVLRLAPGIFQPRIPKSHELRVTMVGDRVFAARLLSQESSVSELDFRGAFRDIPVRPATLPGDVADGCRRLMRRLGIVFGCFDFIVTPEGEHVFLEVNEMGQFLWIEEFCPEIQLLDAFCEFLIQRRLDFDWRQSANSVRFADLRSEEARQEEEAKDRQHVAKPEVFAIAEASGVRGDRT